MPQRIMEVVGVRIQRQLIIKGCINCVSIQHIAVYHSHGLHPALRPVWLSNAHGYCIAIYPAQAPGCEELCEAFIQCGAIGLIRAYHSVEPVVAYLMN